MATETATPLVILGTGYTGRVVYKHGIARGLVVLATSRHPDHHLSTIPPKHRVHFDLGNRTTWCNLPSDCHILWCFPAEPLEQVQDFATTMNLPTRRVVVLGSTSAYQPPPWRDYPPPWIDETAPLDTTKLRVQGEEWLRTYCQAIILRVAGIYGPGRNPLHWITQGRVGPSRKYVNLIHVEDLAAICLVAFEHGRPGEAYNVSDGTPRTWQEICHLAKKHFGVQPIVELTDVSVGKRIDTGKLRSLLAEASSSLLHTDLLQSLKQIAAMERFSEAVS